MVTMMYFFKHSDDRLKLFRAKAGGEVETCPFG